MDPVVELNSKASSYLRGEITAEELKLAIVPLLPYFAERLDEEPLAQLVVDLDSLFIEMAMGESTDSDLRAAIQAELPNPTKELRYPVTATRVRSQSGSPPKIVVWSAPTVRGFFTVAGPPARAG